jgi:hypothetical protein
VNRIRNECEGATISANQLSGQPHLQLIGADMLKADLTRIEKLCGSGPLGVTLSDVDRFWYYNVMTKQFDDSQKRVFQSNLDAVSVL